MPSGLLLLADVCGEPFKDNHQCVAEETKKGPEVFLSSTGFCLRIVHNAWTKVVLELQGLLIIIPVVKYTYR